MKLFLILAAVAVLLFLLLTFVCFYIAFYVPSRKPEELEKLTLPPGKIYLPYKDTLLQWMQDYRDTPHEDVEIRSFDGLRLVGRYYEGKPGAPVELLFHGYRGTAERDMCGGMQRCFELGRNAIIVEQRASGHSDGHVISFGINERRDCMAWIDFVIDRFGPDVKIMLTGISMGAATVMMAGGMELPDNVVGILADCGYTSAKEIIAKVIRQLHLPVKLLYPLIKLGARIYGGFDLEETSPIEAMKRCRVPVIFIHGENDRFVPCEMSRENYEACTAPKRLLTVPNAGHGLSILVDREAYLGALEEFWENCIGEKIHP